MENQDVKTLYRVEARNYSETCWPQLIYEEFPVVRKTEKGFWIRLYGNYGTEKFVLDDPQGNCKRFAYKTKEDALRGFYYRRLRMKTILERLASNNDQVLAMVEKELFGKPNQASPVKLNWTHFTD